MRSLNKQKTQQMGRESRGMKAKREAGRRRG